MRGSRSVVHGFSDVLTSVKGPRLLETTIQVVLTALSCGAGSMPTSRQASPVSPSEPAADAVPVQSADADGNEPGATIVPRRCATSDRETNGSVPRQSRREAKPQRHLTGWSAALSRLAKARQKSATMRTRKCGDTCTPKMRENERHTCAEGASRDQPQD